MSANKSGSNYRQHAALVSKITIRDDLVYIINTEEKRSSSTQVCSRVFLNGKILFSKDADFSHLSGSDDFQQKLDHFLKQHHESVVAHFNAIVEKRHKRKSEYLYKARKLMRQNRHREALLPLKDGLAIFQHDPLLLSYYGFLLSKAENNYREGVRICRDAISKLEVRSSVDGERVHPVYYLNLGRAYLEAKRKKEAVRAFNIGLTSDLTNAELNAEIEDMGRRRRPLFTFLERSNPLNRYIGGFLSKMEVLMR
jgi:tetratricopeptide (TPR) repeat protein